jgi:pyrroloquinoline quinone (PQQ) biosynthesis protein C
VLSSIPLDWYARRFTEISLNFHIFNGFPIPRPDRENPLRVRVERIAAQLAAVDDRYQQWAEAVGVSVASVDADQRTDLIAELDAAVALLYGLDAREVRHIFETFHDKWRHQDRLQAVLRHYEELSRD